MKLIMVARATLMPRAKISSAMKRVKTYLRIKMTNERMNNLMTMHVHKDRLNDLDFVEIGNQRRETNLVFLTI